MSTKITELPAYVGSNNPPGVIPISINGVTYKLYPNQLVPTLQEVLDFNNVAVSIGIILKNQYDAYSQLTDDALLISADPSGFDTAALGSSNLAINNHSIGKYIYLDFTGLVHSNNTGSTQLYFEDEFTEEVIRIPNKSGVIALETYKKFTALLIQSNGTSGFNVYGGSGYFNKGYTYRITDNPNNTDLSSYGAPNNDVGTFFIANQDAALPLDLSLSLEGDFGAPIAYVLENTIGNVWFEFNSDGEYFFRSDYLFGNDANLIPNYENIILNESVHEAYLIKTIYQDAGTIHLITTTSLTDFHLSNDRLNNTFIEIRVYN